MHNRLTCPFSADDGAETEHQKGPRPMSCEINLLFKRFSSGKGQITGLTTYYIAQMPQNAPRASLVSGPHDLAKNGELLRPATISPCTITMDREAIICSMID